MKNFTIVSDPGIDDLVALLLLYKLSLNSTNTLVSTFGNAKEDITSINAKEFISFVAKNWNFIHGAAIPLNGVIERPWPDYFHGPDGTWGIHPEINKKSIVPLSKYPMNNDVISLGTLTSPLQLLQKTEAKAFIVMGGAFTIGGNETPYAETNIAFDPDAAHDFFKQITNQNVKVVPLDVTRKVYWSQEKIEQIPEKNRINTWLKTVLLAWFKNYNHDREKDFNLHDPLAVHLAFFPESAIWKRSGVDVITKGEKRGQTIFNNGNQKCDVAIDVISPENIAKEIYKIIFL